MAGGLFSDSLFERIEQTVQIWIACAKSAREPVSASGGNWLAVRDHIELANGARFDGRCDADPFPDSGRETRSLGLIASSGRARDDFDVHVTFRSLWKS